MESPISSTIPNLGMNKLEMIIDFVPIFCKIYVEDSILCVPSILCVNTFHSRLQFTIEEEKNRTINYLGDALKRNSEGVIETDLLVQKKRLA